jgi:putative flippase GtrA
MDRSSDIEPSPNLLGFAISACLAFALDAGILWSLVQFDIDPLAARVASMAFAIVGGWLVNRTWTYADPSPPTVAEFGRYAASGVLSMGVNYAAFALTLILWPVVDPLEALVMGTAVALVVSFGGYCVAVFDNRA